MCLGSEGYIGSRLVPSLRAAGLEVSTVDLCWYGGDPNYRTDYKNLLKNTINSYDYIICLAAHSSVGMCEADPGGSWKNNVENFRELLDKLSERQYLIYASSASVLQGNTNRFEETSPFHPPLCHYDMQKQVIEMLATKSGKKTIGLRFGTVCGYSPNPRLELMINSMFLDGKAGRINVANPEKYRAILSITDLVRAIMTIINSPKEGVYNLCSFDYSIGWIAREVAKYCGTPEIVTNPPSSTYDFRMNNYKFRRVYDFEFEETIESICLELEGLTKKDKSIYNRSTNMVDHYGHKRT